MGTSTSTPLLGGHGALSLSATSLGVCNNGTAASGKPTAAHAQYHTSVPSVYLPRCPRPFRLPKELLMEVFAFLGDADRRQFRLVCRRWSAHERDMWHEVARRSKSYNENTPWVHPDTVAGAKMVGLGMLQGVGMISLLITGAMIAPVPIGLPLYAVLEFTATGRQVVMSPIESAARLHHRGLRRMRSVPPRKTSAVIAEECRELARIQAWCHDNGDGRLRTWAETETLMYRVETAALSFELEDDVVGALMVLLGTLRALLQESMYVWLQGDGAAYVVHSSSAVSGPNVVSVALDDRAVLDSVLITRWPLEVTHIKLTAV
eukprot:PhM_4_TR1525/c0_g1_i1/m.94168